MKKLDFIKASLALTAGVLAVLVLLFVAGCSDKGDGGEKEKTAVIPELPPTVEGTGELTKGEDIISKPIPSNATFESPVVQEFVELYMEAIGGVLQQALSAAGTRAADSKRTYIGYGSVYGGVRVIHEKGGDIQKESYAYESIANEFFDYSNAEGLYLGGSVGYLNTETRNQSGGINRIEQCDGTIKFNGVFKGEIVFDNVVCSRKIENGAAGKAAMTGKFYLKSGTTEVQLPDSLIRTFCYSQSENEKSLDDDTASGEKPEFVPVERINTEIPTSVNVGDKHSLLASVVPMDANNRKIVWSVEGASIDAQGRAVTFNQVGTAKITATIKDGVSAGKNYTQTWEVKVVGANVFVPVDSIRFAIPNEVKIGEHIDFALYEAVILPANATNRQITWTAEGATILSSSTGANVTGISFNEVGNATITAAIKDGLGENRNYTRTWTVVVSGDEPIVTFVAVDSITASIPQQAQVGGSVTLTGTVNPQNATNRIIDWSWDSPNGISSDGTGAATISRDSNGNTIITFNQPGNITIIATIQSGSVGKDGGQEDYVQSWTVVVSGGTSGNFVPVESIYASIPQQAQVGGSVTLTGSVNPQNATNRVIDWSWDSPNGISFDGTGAATISRDSNGNTVITFNQPGNVTIIATVKNGSIGKDGSQEDYNQYWTVVVSGGTSGGGTSGGGSPGPGDGKE